MLDALPNRELLGVNASRTLSSEGMRRAVDEAGSDAHPVTGGTCHAGVTRANVLA